MMLRVWIEIPSKPDMMTKRMGKRQTVNHIASLPFL